MSDHTENAINTLNDERLSGAQREEGVNYLKDNPTPAGIDALVGGLEDDEYGVRWACASALAALGTEAIKPVLSALCKPDNSTRLREGALHILHANVSQDVQDNGKALAAVLKGPNAQMNTMEEAYKLVDKW